MTTKAQLQQRIDQLEAALATIEALATETPASQAAYTLGQIAETCRQAREEVKR